MLKGSRTIKRLKFKRKAIFVFLVSMWLLVMPSSHTSAQQVVDRMIATVNSGARPNPDLITYTDLLWQLALQPNVPIVRPTSENLNRALNLLIDQRLILQEAERLPTITPSAEEIKNARDELVRAFGTLPEFQERLRRVGLTSPKLDEILEQRLRIEKYLDFRFRNFVVITQSEIADYYESVYVPRLRNRFPGQIIPTLEEAREEIENLLTEAKIESDMDAFLDTARERAEIVILHQV